MGNFHYYLCLISFILLTIKLLTQRKRNLPPSPFSLPIIGHLHHLKLPLYKSWATLLPKYGPILYLRVGSRRILVVSSPSDVEECFGKNDIIFANRPQTMAGDILMYDHRSYVWAPYGPLWRSLRRLSVVEILSSINVQKLTSIREEEVGNFVRRLFEASAAYGSTGKVDMRYLFSLLTMNFSLKLVSGKRGEEVDKEAERMFVQEFKSLFFVGVGTNVCDFFPILKWIGFQGIEKRLKELHRRRDEFLQKLVDGTRLNTARDVAVGKEEGKNPSLIEKLLSFQEKDPGFFSDELIKATALMVFIAGTESTIFTLEWAMSLLLNHPEALEKVRAEMVSNVGNERLLNDSDLANLPYLGCVVDEVLRLYPPAPLLLPHYSSQDCTVGGYEIPKGTLLMVNAWAIHRDPTIWDEPAKFKPERFQGSFQEKEGSKYLPFGLGRRACPGAAMGLRMILLALGTAIQCFEWEKVGSDKVDMTPGKGQFLLKAIPLEALCSPRPHLIKILSQSQTSN
ncbi:cyclin-A3-4-like [Hibiscus syriacus]|uniref:Cyclin-A3-4-like n=1 Tax=Hibiscus syriacus TaxID=106335 RepID=A0A6A2WUU0_HIBSY|nr:cytochrome P450 81C13-like [Hibiscus syriacus]KAE8658850.1 cyclin-A3-4-like [Hibiscus syriacus]